MKTEITLSKPLVEMLEDLVQKPRSFEETTEELFAFNYNDYNLLFELDKITVTKDTYKLVPVY